MLPSFLPNSMLNCETPTRYKKKEWGEVPIWAREQQNTK
jgi:hypothetical protein